MPGAAIAIISLGLTRSAPVPQAEAASATTLSFRITFGERQEIPQDYSGSISISSGEVVRLSPWRFFDGDEIDGRSGWTLKTKRARFESQPDQARFMMTGAQIENVVPAGIVATVDAPASATAKISTAQGDFEVRLSELKYDRVLSFLEGDVVVQRTPAANQISEPSTVSDGEHSDYPSVTTANDGVVWVAWQSYQDKGDHVFARHSTATGWSDTFRLTDEKTDVYRTAIAADMQGRVWVVWSERSGQKWDLYARRFQGGAWTSRQTLTSANHPNIFHRMVADSAGNLHLVWVGHEDGQSYVQWSKLEGSEWSEPRTISGPSAWNPEAAADSRGNLWVTWDSYRHGNYDIFLRRLAPDGTLGPELQVTKSPLFQAHASIAVDDNDRVWLAWHESGASWGKDWTREDPYRGTVLYTDRKPRVAVLDGGEWKQPAVPLMRALPKRYNRYAQYPRLAAGPGGRIWLGLQVRTSSAHNRSDFWAFDGRWEQFLTTLEGDHWSPPMPIPDSSQRPEGPLLLHPSGDDLWLTWSNDNRPVFAPAFYGKIPSNHEIHAAKFTSPGPASEPALVDFEDPELSVIEVHPNENDDVSRIRGYRTDLGGKSYRILRGDFHRHTEISTDGSGDGSLEDYFRYMIDAAALDTGIVGDHNIGNDDEYSWWRTEKGIDLFHIPGRYTPMFGYERSPGYPNGHRNVVFAQRGVPTLPIPPDEFRGKIRTGPILYPYLRQYNGICMLHSIASSQGSDYGDNDPELEPLVELYQGYHASYEYEGAPRAESDNYRVTVHGKFEPAGFWWNALKKGLKLGVQASSDHISTHTSYTMIYTPSAGRTDILESMRSRHAYGATDNIIIDYQAELDGKVYMMGDAFKAKSAPNLRVKILGTGLITTIDIIKDQTFVYHSEPNKKDVEFSFVDNDPGSGDSYYYVRIQQRDRNLAWSSPIWVDYR